MFVTVTAFWGLLHHMEFASDCSSRKNNLSEHFALRYLIYPAMLSGNRGTVLLDHYPKELVRKMTAPVHPQTATLCKNGILADSASVPIRKIKKFRV